jgi:hypothetical protein
MTRARRSILPAAWLLLWTTLAQATTLARLTLDDLVAASAVVARVHCLGSESRWEGGEIWTFTNFEVLETIKGAAPRLIAVRLPGGQVDHWISTVEGVPRFRPGERAIVFLERTRAGDFTIVSWVQGTFRIHRDARTGRESVTQDSSAFAVFDPATREFRPSGIRKLPLEVFRQRLAEAVERTRNGKQP